MFRRMRIHSLAVAVLLLTSCERKSPHDEGGAGGASGKNPWTENTGSAGAMAPKDKAPKTVPPPTQAQPAMPPPPAGNDDVRPPVAADLAEYTKDLKGNGPLSATIETSMGTFHCELFGDKTPMTVANFVGLATGKKPWLDPKSSSVAKGKPFFDGLIFHRVIPGFMIQGGDPLGQGTGGPGYKFADETTPDLKMEPGTLAMANSGPSTNGSQFFITEGAPDWLNGKHTIFGRCKEADLVTKMEAVDRGPNDRPKTPITITKVTISK